MSNRGVSGRRVTGAPTAVDGGDLAGVDAVVDVLVAHVGELSGEQASQELTRLARTVAKLSAYRVALVARVEASGIWKDEDSNATPESFLREELVVDRHEVAADLRAASSFDRFPLLKQACLEGLVSRDKMDLILRTGLRNQAREDALPQFMPIFVEMAETMSTSALRKVLDHWVEQVDPVATSRDEEHAHSRRALHITERSNGVKIDGWFGKAQGMQLIAALNGALAAHWAKNGRIYGTGEAKSTTPYLGGAVTEGPVRGAARVGEAAGDRGGLPVSAGASGAGGGRGDGGSDGSSGGGINRDGTGVDDIAWIGEAIYRATAQQRADAFIDAIIGPVLDSGLLPTSGGAPATVVVTVPLDRLEDPGSPVDLNDLQARISAGMLHLGSPSIQANNGPGGAVLSTDGALRLSCDSTVQRVILSPAGRPLDVGRKTRTIPEQIRTALVLRDQGCIFPQCDKPASWTHAHHIVHWAQGGPTNLDNLALLCSRHHHKVHAENIPIITSAAGIPHVKVPYHRRP